MTQDPSYSQVARFTRASRRVAVGVATAALLVVPFTTATVAQDDDPLNVVVTFSVLADIVENVGDDHIDLVTIVGAGGDAHTLDPNPEQVASIADADLIFEIGLGFEPWLDDMYEASGSTAERVFVTDADGMDLIPAGEDDDHEGEAEATPGDEAEPVDEHEGEAASEEEHGEYDPHVWHDVTNTMQMVEVIRDALTTADPTNAETYDANAESYLAELQELDDFIFEQVEMLPEERRKLVTSHDTFGYFAQRYDFEILGTAISSISTDVGDPSAQAIAQLVAEIEESGVPAIFAENVSNPSLMESIAAEASVELAPTLYTDALGEPGSEGDTYIGMMRYNVVTIVTALEE